MAFVHSIEGLMASRPKITGRGTTLAAAFVQAIIPRRIDEVAQAALYERFGIDAKKCVYCGGNKTDDDHLRAIVRRGKPSGYFHTIGNVVPACGPCNQSKGGSDWLAWMTSTRAKGSPTKKGTTGTDARIELLAKFAEVANSMCMSEQEMREAVGHSLWDRYWARLDAIKSLMADAQKEAEQVCDRLQAAFDSRTEP
jgi:hypothetical protein